MTHSEYFENLEQIEKTWKYLLAEKFPEKGKLELIELTTRGRVLLKKVIDEIKRNGWAMLKSIPSYEREIMLLEREFKYKEAIELCDEAIAMGVNSPWYQKKIEKLNKR